MTHSITLHPQQSVVGRKFYTILCEETNYKVGDSVTFVERNGLMRTDGIIMYVGNRPNNTVFKTEITVHLNS